MALIDELQKPEYQGLAHNDAARLYNSKRVTVARPVRVRDIQVALTADEILSLTSDQLARLSVIRDLSLDLDNADDLAKLETVFVANSSAHTKALAMRFVETPEFAQVNAADVKAARGQ